MLNEVDDWRSPATRDLFGAILALPDQPAAERFFRDLCTLRELHDLAQRWQVARLLDAGLHYGDISRLTGASTATITRIAAWLKHGAGGYRDALSRSRRRPKRNPPQDARGAKTGGAKAGGTKGEKNRAVR